MRKPQLKLKHKQQLQLICGFVACLHVLIYGVIKVTTYQTFLKYFRSSRFPDFYSNTDLSLCAHHLLPNQQILQNVNLTKMDTIYQLCSAKTFTSCGEKNLQMTLILMFTKVVSLDVDKFKLILFWEQKWSLENSLHFCNVTNNLLHGGICKLATSR